LIKDDCAEFAYSSHCESTELEREVAGAGHKRSSDGEQDLGWTAQVHQIWARNPAG
jgi:hypothetical protein